MVWEKLSHEEIRSRVFAALDENSNFKKDRILGLPGTHLDESVFPQIAIPDEMAYLQAFFQNPNHIGVHTLKNSEKYFSGTQKLEVESLQMFAEDIMKVQRDEFDGHMTTGGTEANIQGLWMARNFFLEMKGISSSEILVLHSSDTHYSVYKACNLLCLRNESIEVDDFSRRMKVEELRKKIYDLIEQGIKKIIFVLNLGTTMFGSVDDLSAIKDVVDPFAIEYWVHVDAAYGGLFYPFTVNNQLNFERPEVMSISLDAHKVLQAPYGSGTFLCRKGYYQYTHTQRASYVSGGDATLSASRSGANVVAVWMILKTHGFTGLAKNCRNTLGRTNVLMEELTKRKIPFFNEPGMNIVTIRAEALDHPMALRFGLVPDRQTDPRWFKIVVMEHVTVEKIKQFLAELA